MSRNIRDSKNPVSRRALLRSSYFTGAGLLAASMVGCGDDDDDTGSSSATGTAPSGGDTPQAGSSPQSNVKTGGKVSVVVPEPADLNPHTGIGGNEHQTLWLIHDNIIAYDDKSVARPELSLAESWEIVSPTEIAITLRDGIKFHDGEDLTAEVVKYNLELVLDPATAAVSRGQIAPISTIDVPDAKTVVLKLSQPSASLILALGDRGGMVVSRKAMEAKGLKGYAAEPTGGTGPFKFKSWVRNSNLSVTRNDAYWRTRDGAALPHLDEIELKFITEAAVQIAALQSGEAAVSPISPEDIPVVEGAGLALAEFNGASTSIIHMNRTLPLFQNPLARQALSYVADRAAMVAAITDGRSEIARGMLTPAQWAYDPSLRSPERDLKRAKQLLDAAAIAPGTKFKAITYAGREPEKRQVELMQQALTEFGIELETEFLQSGAAFELYKEGKHDGFFTGFSIRADPHGSLGENYLSKSGFAWTQNPLTSELEPDVDQLLRKANEEYDLDKRKQLYNEAQDLIVNEYAMSVFLYYNNSNLGMSKSIEATAPMFGGEGKPRFAELYKKS